MWWLWSKTLLSSFRLCVTDTIWNRRVWLQVRQRSGDREDRLDENSLTYARHSAAFFVNPFDVYFLCLDWTFEQPKILQIHERVLFFSPSHKEEFGVFCALSCRRERCLLRITMYLAALVLILIATGIAKGNLIISPVRGGPQTKRFDFHKCFLHWLCVFQKSIRYQYFIALNVSNGFVPRFFLDVFWRQTRSCRFLSVSKVGNAAPSAT